MSHFSNYNGVTAGGNANTINYGGVFSAWALSAAQLTAAGGPDHDYHTVIINEVPNALMNDRAGGYKVALYHPYVAGLRFDWNGAAHRPGLISLVTSGLQAAKEDINDIPAPPTPPWAGSRELQLICNAVVHEAFHAVGMTTNSEHCANNTATCVINRTSGAPFLTDLSGANPVAYYDVLNTRYFYNQPFHDRISEINLLQRRTNRTQQ